MKTLTFARARALKDGRLKPIALCKPTHVVKGPNGWNIVPDLVKA